MWIICNALLFTLFNLVELPTAARCALECININPEAEAQFATISVPMPTLYQYTSLHTIQVSRALLFHSLLLSRPLIRRQTSITRPTQPPKVEDNIRLLALRHSDAASMLVDSSQPNKGNQLLLYIPVLLLSVAANSTPTPSTQ